MVAAPEFSSFWKEVREVAAPYGRIFPLAMFLGLGCIENRLDAAAKSCRRFWLFDPERLQDSEDCLRVDLINRPGP
jgi:hypothetical protein